MSTSGRNFNEIASGKAGKKKREAPFSLRLTFAERAALQKMAGDMPLGAFIKAVLFAGTKLDPQASISRIADDQALGRVLGQLGKSRLSSNVNQLAKAVNRGTLPVTPETENELKEACRAVQEMRDALLAALSSEGGP